MREVKTVQEIRLRELAPAGHVETPLRERGYGDAAWRNAKTIQEVRRREPVPAGYFEIPPRELAHSVAACWGDRLFWRCVCRRPGAERFKQPRDSRLRDILDWMVNLFYPYE